MDFWTWSIETYGCPGVETLLLRLQDKHLLNVNLILWCLWCADKYEEQQPGLILKAMEVASTWDEAVVAPVRKARKSLKSIAASVGDAAALGDRLKACELDAERLLQNRLEHLAIARLATKPAFRSGTVRARRNLAAYIRQTGASKTPGFSVSLLEELIALTLRSPDSDGATLQAQVY